MLQKLTRRSTVSVYMCVQCVAMSMACSAKTLTRGVHEVFDFAHRMMEYPVPPLYDKLSQVPCVHVTCRVPLAV